MHAYAILPLIAVSLLLDLCGRGRHAYVCHSVLTIILMVYRSLWTCSSSSSVYPMDPTGVEVTTGAPGAAVKDLVEATGAAGVAVEALQCSMALRWMQRAAIPWLLLIAAVKTSAIIQLALNVWSMKMDLKDQVGTLAWLPCCHTGPNELSLQLSSTLHVCPSTYSLIRIHRTYLLTRSSNRRSGCPVWKGQLQRWRLLPRQRQPHQQLSEGTSCQAICRSQQAR